jgi:hypothetical protein
MNGRNAIRIGEPTIAASHNARFDGLVWQSAIVYTWTPTTNYLASAIRRAFSFRYKVLKRVADISPVDSASNSLVTARIGGFIRGSA